MISPEEDDRDENVISTPKIQFVSAPEIMRGSSLYIATPKPLRKNNIVPRKLTNEDFDDSFNESLTDLITYAIEKNPKLLGKKVNGKISSGKPTLKRLKKEPTMQDAQKKKAARK